MDEDEDSRLFLSMLDAAAESIFEACSQIAGAESSAVSVAYDTETSRQSTNSLQEDNELCSVPNLVNAPPPASQEISPIYPRKRRKRSWNSDQSVQQQPLLTRKTNVGGNEITSASIDWPQTQIFSAPSNMFVKPSKVSRAKETLTFAKNFNHHRRKRALRSNVGLVRSSVDRFSPGALLPDLPPIVGNEGFPETDVTKKRDDFSKEIYEAIDRIESLIPSLQKLVDCVQVPSEQNSTFCAGGNAKFYQKEFKVQNETVSHTVPVLATNFTSAKTNVRIRLEEGSGRSRQPNSRVHGQVTHFPMCRDEPLRQTSSKNESVTSHTSEYLQGLRAMPCQYSKNIVDQKQTNKHVLGKDVRFRFQDSAPSVGSSSVRRTKKISNTDHEASKNRARERTTQFGDSIHRSSIRRKSMNQISEETSPSSRASCSGTSTDTYNSGSDQPGTYSSGSYETWSGLSDRSRDYETSSLSISRDQYSDASAERSTERSHHWGNHLEKRGNKVGRMSKLRKKLGMVFHHHHHHHHHHYGGRDEPYMGHVGLLKRLGKMFRRRGKPDYQRQKSGKSKNPATKSMVRKNKDVGHFRALIDGLIRHMRPSKNSKKAKDDDIERFGSGRSRFKKGKNKLFRWPKGKVKLARVATRARRPLLLR